MGILIITGNAVSGIVGESVLYISVQTFASCTDPESVTVIAESSYLTHIHDIAIFGGQSHVHDPVTLDFLETILGITP